MSRNLSSQLTQWIESHLPPTANSKQDGPAPVPALDGAPSGPLPARVLAIETVTLRISEHEIYWAAQTRLKKPILVALQRATGTLWRLFDDGTAIEVMTPHRACVLPQEALFEVEEANEEHPAVGSEWEVPLFPTSPQDGYSLIQRHRVLQTADEGRRGH